MGEVGLMATEQEKALYGCIAVVEDAAKGLKTLQEAVRETIETEARRNSGMKRKTQPGRF